MKHKIYWKPITAGLYAAIFAVVVSTSSCSKENGQGGGGDMRLLDNLDSMEQTVQDNAESAFETDINPTSYNLSYISYRVRKGDIIGRIAEKFNVSTDSIFSLNGVTSARNIQIDSYLKIPTISGILYTAKGSEDIESVAKKFGVDAEKCAAVNNLQVASLLEEEQTIFVPDAKLDAETVQKINGDLFKKPIHAKWYRSSSFGWRSNPFTGSRSYHNGIDMACPRGTSIYSAMAGKVTSTGFSPVYGNYVIVSHHSGYKTLYGHMDSILCIKNQFVDSGTVLGRVGSTGMSTGPHLHFTVYKNNVAVNPAVLWR